MYLCSGAMDDGFHSTEPITLILMIFAELAGTLQQSRLNKSQNGTNHETRDTRRRTGDAFE